MYTHKNLEGISYKEITECFNLSFSDYQLPVRFTDEQLKTRLIISGVDKGLSFGAFYNKQMIGFIFNSCNIYNGDRVVFDVGTGVVPQHRGNKVFTNLYTFAEQQLTVNNIEKYYLEVLYQNDKAMPYRKKDRRIKQMIIYKSFHNIDVSSGLLIEKEIEVVMKACTTFTFSSTNESEWQENYKKFISDGEPTDEVEITIHINKKFDVQNALSIYCFDEFISYYNKLPSIELLKFFVLAFSKHTYLRFEVLDRIVELYTHSIGFCQDEDVWPNSDISRLENLKKCEGASLFLNRIDIPLVPCDFELLGNIVDKDRTTIELFRKLETIFSYLYLANSSYLIDEKIVLQFSPTQSGFDYEIKNIVDNRYICQIFKWAYGGENSVERVGIARNVICINCKKAEQIIEIDEDILNSIKSNYMLYQRKTTEQYIEMKNQISSFIVDSSKQLQEMIHGLIDGLKNNFIAVIMFLITIILTDSVDWEDFLNTGVLSQDLTFVTKIFVVASTAYLVVTFVAMIVKWLFFKSAYLQLKSNYKEVFDAKDMNKAFDDDKIVKKARVKIIIAAIVIGVVWIVFLGVIYYFISQVSQVK